MRARTFLVVLGVTLVIWLYAEAESLTRAEREVAVVVLSRSEESAVRVADTDWRGVVRLRVEGSTAAISKTPRAVELSPGDGGVPVSEGDHTIDLRATLLASDEFAGTGIGILSAEPSYLHLNVSGIDRLTDVEVRAEVSGVALAGAPTVAPAMVTVVGPRETMRRLAGALGGAAVVARVQPQAAAAAAEGVPTPVAARLALPAGFDETDVSITPREATVTITRGAGDSWQAPPPMVRVIIPTSAVGAWRVDPPEDQRFVRGVVVQGPPAQVDRFRSGELTLIAVIVLTQEDLEQRRPSRSVTFLAEKGGAIVPVPAGVTVSAPETAVRLTIEPLEPPKTQPRG